MLNYSKLHNLKKEIVCKPYEFSGFFGELTACEINVCKNHNYFLIIVFVIVTLVFNIIYFHTKGLSMMKKGLLTALACGTMAVLLNGCSCDMKKKEEAPKVETPAAIDAVATEAAPQPEVQANVDAVATEVAPEAAPATPAA